MIHLSIDLQTLVLGLLLPLAAALAVIVSAPAMAAVHLGGTTAKQFTIIAADNTVYMQQKQTTKISCPIDHQHALIALTAAVLHTLQKEP